MGGTTQDALQKMDTELQLIHSIEVTDLVKITTYQEFNIRKQCLEQDNNMLQEHIMAKESMA